MCGIAGMAGIEDKSLLDAMLKVTRHRGPDDWGTYVAGGTSPAAMLAFGNNRLKILDLTSAGHQPMSTYDGSVWVVFNGEIFNFQALRDELESDGVKFRSHADTEVLGYLYQKYGAAMVERLNGMFAFALWDRRQRTLLIARDRMGIKPLYYTQVQNRLYFASEIKALLTCDEIEPELDPAALREFLSLLYVPNPGTMFKSIVKLPPGHLLFWRNGTVRLEKFWDGSKPVEYFQDSEADLIARCRQVLQDSVRRQLISDVPVGFFLSGGLDSSAVLACASRTHQGPLRCYSIVFSDEHGKLEQSNDDAFYSKQVAAHFQADWHQIVAHPDVVDLLPKVTWHLDDAIADHAAIATYLICREAKENVTVLLSGQGGDEVFAGYRVHLVDRITRWLRIIPATLRRGLLTNALKSLANHPGMVPAVRPGLVLAYSRFLQKLLRLSDLNPIDQYVSMRSYLDEDEIDELLSPEMRGLARVRHDEKLLEHFADASDLDFVNQMLYADQQTFLPDLNLAYSDKLSMAASIEARVPFLDNEVVDFMRRVPPQFKLRGYTQKYLLKKSMERLLPRDVIYRRKAGFGLPVRSWLRNELREMLGDLLSPDRIRQRGILNPKTVARFLRQNESGERDYTLQLWALLTLEVWQQCMVDGRQLALSTKAANL
ncbi:MAG: asparagine synthase (glutamine-hydrolyzing) [Candidatus Korobacteraceae bacterium]